ncbi:MAG: EAL domain-containing protein [Gammaproteobacteria bacterium]|nr:MAG: EAL domain-containing protein [Gammaproteobacteria bacterium]
MGAFRRRDGRLCLSRVPRRRHEMKLLLVEDCLDDADFLAASLRRNRTVDVELTHVGSLRDARRCLEQAAFDVVLLDLHLPDGSGMECVDVIQEAETGTPIVVLSGRDDEEFALSILNKGVQDYLAKWEGETRGILRAIRYAIERKRSEMRLNYLAQYDPLTEIPNRQYFNDQLARATSRARREGRKVALFFLDLDHFKVVNDTLGHNAGDVLLKETAQRLRQAVRAGDVLARLGGDEFAVLLEGIGGPLDAEAVARAILDVVAKPFQVEGREVSVTTSIGITLYPADHGDPDMLLKNADIAMYQAKEQGRNNFKFFTERMQAELLAYHSLEHDIREALANEEFRLVYQPKVNVVDRRLQGLEALLRWDCPRRGEVTPAEFIPVAEQSGHIVPLGQWVLHEVCRTLNRWAAAGLPLVPVSVNVSARQFQQAAFHQRIADVLQRHAIEPAMLEIELTEGLLMEDTDSAQRALQQLKATGVRVSIDDFGTGHSCLNYLRRFPIDVLKIDRSFIQEVDGGNGSAMIVRAIISLARSLQLDTVAEGVETHEQLEFLVENGCEVAQGFLFGMPMDAREIVPLLEDLRDDEPGFATARLPIADSASG